MILSVFCTYCILQHLITSNSIVTIGEASPNLRNYCKVFGEEDVYFRFLKEEGFKPPIFGSYHFDPIKQEFEMPERHSKNISQIVNSTYVLSTAVGIVDADIMNATDAAVYRQHVTIITKRPAQWWAVKLGKTTKNPRLKY